MVFAWWPTPSLPLSLPLTWVLVSPLTTLHMRYGSLTQVLHSISLLTSWRKIDELGHFRMIGENGVIEIRNKINDSVIISALLMHGSYQVLLIVRHGKIYVAATDFWHMAPGHFSTHFWSTATDIYQD